MPIVNGYCSLADVKASAKITDTVDDGLLELAVESASRLIDSYTQRYFYSAGTATRLFAPLDSYVAEVDDLISLSVLQTSDGDNFGTTWAAKDYQLEPLNGVTGRRRLPIQRPRRRSHGKNYGRLGLVCGSYGGQAGYRHSGSSYLQKK
jgi:hypothetical protein